MECVWDGKILGFGTEGHDDIPEETKAVLCGGTTSQYLDALATLSLKPRWTDRVFAQFEPLFVDFCQRWRLETDIDFTALEQVAALARILPLAPHLSLYAQDIACQRGLGEFSTIRSRNTSALSDLPEPTLCILLVTIARLLEFDNHGFESLVSPAQIQVLLNNDKTYIRYLALKILCLYLHAADAAFNTMYEKFIGTHIPLGPWEGKSIDYRFLHLWEKKRLTALKDALKAQKPRAVSEDSTTVRPLNSKDLCPSTTCLAGVLVPSTVTVPDTPPTTVMTPATIRNIRLIAEGLRDSRALLVTGQAGSGKTTIIREMARTLGHQSDLLTLHLNEQTDAKLLIGLYTSGTAPGTFRWQPGVLTTAVKEGRWVFIEDLDRAPTEVVSMLLPLLDRGELLVPNLGGLIHAARGFKLVATVRSVLNTRLEERTPGMNMLGFRHWTRTRIEMLSDQDLSQIIRTKYTRLHAYEPRIMSMFHALKTEVDYQPSQTVQASSSPRPIGTLELLRYCARLDALLLDSGVHTGNEPIPNSVNDCFLLEAVDCFSAAIPLMSVKLQMATLVAKELHFSAGRMQYCLQSRIPAFLENDKGVKIGRTSLVKAQSIASSSVRDIRTRRQPFVRTNHVLRNMEALGVAVKMKEPCLLVGETGTGKTTIIQELAGSLRRRLVVVNLSQQSEAGDLLGGYKPMDIRTLAKTIKQDFDDLFVETFPSDKNELYLKAVDRVIRKSDWARALKLWQEALKKFQIMKKTKSMVDFKSLGSNGNPRKRRRIESQKYERLKAMWDKFGSQVVVFRSHVQSESQGFAFSFKEGNVVKAVRDGSWVLLDEINLASPDTLENIADLISNGVGNSPSILLSETGDVQRIYAHPDFRIFGAMNPATDVGKRDLPLSLRSRFTEYFIHSPDQDFDSLIQIIESYLGSYCHDDTRAAHDTAQLYSSIRKLENENRLVDGADQRPHFSLRTLTRTLSYVKDITPTYGLRRSLFEGFSMSFLTLLNQQSISIVIPLIDKHLLSRHKNSRALLNQIPRCPGEVSAYVRFEHYWMTRGTFAIEKQPHYIITPFVKANLLNLVRATSTRRYPVLLQGPTSSGKTSMVEYLAKISGNKFVRINNHEHTDLQEYLGTYVSGDEGLQFREGILVRALREGHWIVLDELNLAPTDVLEALNRLLDDNRELLIPETQEVVSPHTNFMLFATQNPPGLYGGRKILSRAFRNRFLELHFDDIPENELETILRERSQIAPSYCTNIVAVYKRLAILRQSGRLFEQKNSFATLRDLFRWALRGADSREALAINGFMLLAERVRKPEERLTVKEVIEEVMRVKIIEEDLYGKDRLKNFSFSEGSLLLSVIWTKSMRRLYTLILRALNNKEPVLLVGATGCGKTTVCQAIAESLGKDIHILNAHQNTETGDLIGAQRPTRNKSFIETQLRNDLVSFLNASVGMGIIEGSSTLAQLVDIYQSLTSETKEQYLELRYSIEQRIIKMKALFEWCDGSLVSAMKNGDHFLLDEISLADDSVLERLNSVLEPSRTLFLAEKGSEDSFVAATESFQFLATMNPGGDFGKKELSPALRNRFTEIWVPSLSAEEDIFEIVSAKLSSNLAHLARPMVQFSLWYSFKYNDTESQRLSVREVLAWVDFVNKSQLPNIYQSVLHGAAMVYIDGIGANPAAKSTAIVSIPQERAVCLSQLSELFHHDMASIHNTSPLYSESQSSIIIGPFQILKLSNTANQTDFSFEPPTTLGNAVRIARALQLPKPILIEGNPGVGKTTLVQALASAIGVKLERINLSEQTDIMDLFGSDTPVEGGQVGQFAWHDAPFLQAMKRGDWVLLDEMNLASQSVLEGLNACLDHRGSVYIPELDQTFTRHPNFTMFAAQNPHKQGGGRKGLPASFVNRFTVVYANLLTVEDLLVICAQRYPETDANVTLQIINYVSRIGDLTSSKVHTISGGPWDFNLRDIFRWLDLLSSKNSLLSGAGISDFQTLLVTNRFRSIDDVETIQRQVELPIDENAVYHTTNRIVSDSSIQSGYGFLERGLTSSQPILGNEPDSQVLESVTVAVQRSWPCLLVGPSGSGKSRLIDYLAVATGADVVTVSLNTDMDTMDLVGGYEQTDYQRHVSAFLQYVVKKLKISLVHHLSASIDINLLLECREICNKADNPDLLRVYEILDFYGRKNQSIDYMDLALECKSLIEKASETGYTRFEWIDGILVKALEAGQWLVLDNANLCSSSVLDRLNSLLEPDGVLAINEHHSPEGSAKIIKPHNNFRLFLTMDPRNGELSRAMRNRCIELYLRANRESQDANVEMMTGITSLNHFHRFMLFDWNHLDESKLLSLLSTCCECLSLNDFETFNAWFQQALQGLLVFQPSRLEVCRSLLESYLEVWSGDWKIKTNVVQFYESLISACGLDRAASRSVLMAQSIHPLNNPPLLAVHKNLFSPSRALWLAVVSETLVNLSHFNFAISSIQASLGHKPKTAMTHLERSILSNEVLSFSRDPTKPLFDFLISMLKSLEDWVDQEFSINDWLASSASLNPDSPYQLSVMRTPVEVLKAICYSLDAIFRASHMGPFDGGKFQAHLMIARSLADETRHTRGLYELGSIFASHLDSFDVAWKLSTGGSMEALWNHFRSLTSPSIADLSSLIELEALANMFDNLVWRSTAPLETLLQLRQSLMSAFRILSVESKENQHPFHDLERALREEDARIGPQVPFELPYFAAEFESLRQYSQLSNGDSQQRRNMMLDLLAGRSTDQSLSVTESDTSSSLFSQLLGSTGIDSSYADLAAIRQVLPMMLLKRMGTMADVPLNRLDRLREELSCLCREVSHTTNSMSQDQCRLLNNRLYRLHIEVYRAHRDFIEPLSFKCLETYFEALDSQGITEVLPPAITLKQESSYVADPKQFQQVVTKYLMPSLIQLHEVQREPNRLQTMACAWINFFLGCLWLYIPDRPYDPALKPRIQLETWSKRKTELENKLWALKTFDASVAESDTSFRRQLIKEELMLLGNEPKIPSIARPATSELHLLQAEFSSILNIIAQRGPITKKTISNLGQESLTGRDEALLLRQSISQSIARLTKNHRVYNDLTKPVVGFLRGLDVGLALLLIDTQESTLESKYTPLRSVPLPFFGMNMEDLIILVDPTSSERRAQKLDDRLWLLKRISLEQVVCEDMSQSTLTAAMNAFHSLFREWKDRLGADRDAHIAKSSLYRYQGGQVESDAFDEAEFQDLFPTYDESANERQTRRQTLEMDPQSLAWATAEIHDTFVRKRDNASDILQAFVKELSMNISSLYSESSHSCFPLAPEHMLSSVILNLYSCKESLSDASTQTRTYNFYKDTNLGEAKILVNLLRRIQDRFRDLNEVEDVSGHATLLDVLRTTNELLDFRHTEPVAKMLTKAEKLHRFIHEWQTTAPRHLSAVSLYDELTQLLVSWRRLELSTWARLLDMEDEKCLQDVRSWWFIAYEAILAPIWENRQDQIQAQSYMETLTAEIQKFLMSTSLGQYTSRLRLLASFSHFAKILGQQIPAMAHVHAILESIHGFYGHFEDIVLTSLQTGREALEKKMKEILLLASWKDTNINALRESARRSHQRLFRVVRKYRDLLSRPVEPLVQKGVPGLVLGQSKRDVIMSSWPLSSIERGAFATCERSLAGWPQRSNRYKDTRATASQIARLTQFPASEWQCAACINDFHQNLVATIAALQKETPSTLSVENKDTVKHLKSRKRKVFADTLKELRLMGIRSNLDEQTLSKQTELHRVLANTAVDHRISSSEPQLYGTLENFAIIRETSRQHSDDLSSNDVTRSLGYLEGLLNILLRQRSTLVASYESLDACDKFLGEVENLWCPMKHDVHLAMEGENEAFASHSYRVNWVVTLLDTSCQIVEKHERMGGFNFSGLKTRLGTWKDKMENVKQGLKGLPILPFGLTTTSHEEAKRQVEDLSDDLSIQLDQWKIEFPEVAYVLNQIRPWLYTTSAKQGASSSSCYEPPYPDHHNVPEPPWSTTLPNDVDSAKANDWMLSKIDSEILMTLDSALVGIQKISETLSSLPQSSEDASWLQITDSCLTKALKYFRLGKVMDHIRGSLFGGLLHLDQGNAKVAIALSSVTLPILQQYRNSYLEIVTRYSLIHTSLCTLAYVLSNSFKQIVAQGFCTPQEKSSNEDRTGKLEDGVGLGDGEGAEDISKDIQDDEDVSEMAQEPNVDKNDDLKDEDDAVDMQHDDLEGELGEEGEGEQDEGDEERSQDGNDDIDEEVGNVDELDPSAIDEKLWEGEREEDQREKQGDKAQGQEQDDVAATQEHQGEKAEQDQGDEDKGQDELGAQENDEVVQGKEENLDQHVDEGQKLDLPDEMQLDGDKEMGLPSDDDMADDMSEASEKETGEMEDKNEEIDDEDDNNLPVDEDLKVPKVNGPDVEDSSAEESDADNPEDNRDAASPVDTEPEDIEPDDTGLLKDRDHDANEVNENSHDDDARGTGVDDQQEMASDREQEGGTQGANGMQQDPSDRKGDQAMADTGDLGPASEQKFTEEGRNERAEDQSSRQPFQKLGEALEKWHRQNEKIHEAQDKDQKQTSAAMEHDAPDQEFEHLANDDAEADSQALGAANEDQASALDKRAFDAEMQDEPQDFVPDVKEDHESEDIEMQEADADKDARDNKGLSSKVGAMIGPDTSRDPIKELSDIGAEAEDVEEIDNTLSAIHFEEGNTSTRSLDDARRLWLYCESATRELSLSLTEQLRLILAPTLATKMRGDFRTGKRLNIKRIIPYIASQYKRDKIWMRRSIPSKRNYQIMLAVDDSKSMGESSSGRLAFETLALMSRSLSMLEAGQICIIGFGDDVRIAHPFDQQFSSEAGVSVFQQFTFQQTRTDVRKLISKSLEVFREARAKQFGAGADLWQLQLIISDGICEDHESIRRLVRQAHEERVMIVFAVVDALKGESIMDMTQAIFEPDEMGETKLRMKRYLDGFPFGYYLIVGDVKDLPNVLSAALRQFFAETVEAR